MGGFAPPEGATTRTRSETDVWTVSVYTVAPRLFALREIDGPGCHQGYTYTTYNLGAAVTSAEDGCISLAPLLPPHVPRARLTSYVWSSLRDN